MSALAPKQRRFANLLLAAFPAALTLIVIASGCAGHGTAASTTAGLTGSTTATSTTGTTASTTGTTTSSGGSTGGAQTVTGAQFQIGWPARTRQLDHNLTSALSVAVTLKAASATGQDVTMNVDRNSAPAAYTGTYTLSQPILAKTSMLTATFYAGAGETSGVVGTATAAVSFTGASLNLASIVVSGVIKAVAVTPATLTVGGGTAQLNFTATDVNNNVVAVSPGSAAFAVVTGAGFMTITQDGIATPVAAGASTVTATVDNVTSPAATITVNAASPILATSSWPKFHANLVNAGLGGGNSGPGQISWTAAAGGSLAGDSPIVGPDGTIYIGCSDSKLYAFTSSGSIKWTYATGAAILSPPALASDGTVYVGSTDGNLYAIASTGSLKWKIAGVGSGTNEFLSGVTIGTDGTVFAVNFGTLYAVSSQGAVKWTCTLGSNPSGPVRGCPAIGSDGTIYVGGWDNNLYAVSSAGKINWTGPTGGPIVYSSPTVAADGTIYVGSQDDNLYAFTPTGAVKWTFAAVYAVETSPAIGPNGTIYFGANDGHCYGVSPTGVKVAEYGSGGSIGTSPAVGGDGTLYFAIYNETLGGTNAVYAVTPSTGALVYAFGVPALIISSSPAIGPDGTVYYGGSDGNLYAIH